jgi:4-hydroxy-tetrahydrodipicolinate synthase
VAIATETLVRLSEHPRIVANKDAKGDLAAASWAIARSGLAWYSGDDMLNLPLLSVGAVGFVSVVGHVVTGELRAMLDAFLSGDPAKATEIHQRLLPVFTGMFRTQGVITTKAALAFQGLPAGPLRLPLVEATEAEAAQLRSDLAAGGVHL